MLSSKQTIQAFRHPAAIKRFKRDFPHSAHKAEQLFEDLMLFFWGTKHHELLQKQNPTHEDLDFVFIMDDEMKDVDHMWHIFLLYTKDYMDFCQNHFGEYLHHLPDIIPDGRMKILPYEVQLERFLQFAHAELGEEILERWFPISIQTTTQITEDAL